MNNKIIVFLSVIFCNSSLCTEIPVHKCERNENDCIFKNVTLNLTNYEWQPASDDPPSVDMVLFDGSVNPVLTKNICSKFKSLECLSIKDSGVQEIAENAFRNCRNLTTLSLYQNKITKLLPNTFKGLHNLIELDLGSNQIRKLSDLNLFAGLTNLVTLHLDKNLLTEFPVEMLKNNRKLKKLYLYSNDLWDLDVERLVEFLPKLSDLQWNDNQVPCTRAKQANEVLHSKGISFPGGADHKVRAFEKEWIKDKFACQPDSSWIARHYSNIAINVQQQQLLSETTEQNEVTNQTSDRKLEEIENRLSTLVDQKMESIAQLIIKRLCEKVEEKLLTNT